MSSSVLAAPSPIQLIVGGKILQTNMAPVNVEGRILVPMRVIFEELGATVTWDAKERSASASKDKLKVKLVINQKIGYVNGQAVQMDIPATIINERTYVPTRWVAETLGYNVDWDQKNQTVIVGTSSQSPISNEIVTRADVNSDVLSFEEEVVSLVNDIRVEAGLQSLKLDSHISDVARLKSEDLRDNDYFDHQSPTYGSPFDMMESYNVEYSYAGENIAAGQKTPEEVVNAWMNSPGHKANILKKEFDTIGVGYAVGGSYKHYWTQMFIQAR